MLEKNTISSIAIFRALQLGDMLCVIPTVRAMRAAFPDASITLIGLGWQTDLVKRFPKYFDNFVEFPGWPGLPEIPWDPKRCIEFVSAMQNMHFDLVLQMQGNGILTNSMCLLWNARHTAGLRKSSEMISKGSYAISEDTEHEVLRFLKIADLIGAERNGTGLEFPISENERGEFSRACEVLQIRTGKYVCLHPGARDPRRRWPLDKFASVAEAIYNAGYEVLITGSTSELDLMQELQKRSSAPLINSVEKLGSYGVGLLGALIDNAELLVSNDTGVSHIAAARKVPSVIIFSPHSDQKRWAPIDSQLHIAISAEESEHEETVVSCALKQLQQNRSRVLLDKE